MKIDSAQQKLKSRTAFSTVCKQQSSKDEYNTENPYHDRYLALTRHHKTPYKSTAFHICQCSILCINLTLLYDNFCKDIY